MTSVFLLMILAAARAYIGLGKGRALFGFVEFGSLLLSRFVPLPTIVCNSTRVSPPPVAIKLVENMCMSLMYGGSEKNPSEPAELELPFQRQMHVAAHTSRVIC